MNARALLLFILVFLDPSQHTFPLKEGNNIILSSFGLESVPPWQSPPAHACGLPPSRGWAGVQGAAQAGGGRVRALGAFETKNYGSKKPKSEKTEARSTT